jgi:hypothetical protein
LGATSGGTSQSTYTTGDIIYASASNTLAKLPIGTAGQVLSVASGVPSWSSAGGSTILTTDSFTATAAQTSFSVTYTPALLQGVYRNGVKLDPSDYTATSGTAIVLNTGANLGDNIQVQYFSSLATTTAVNSISFGSTGLTPSTATSGDVTVAGTLGVANGGTGTSTAFTTGSVVFAGASGTYTQDNANLFWDDTNNRLGIGTTAPDALLTVNTIASFGDGAVGTPSIAHKGDLNTGLWFPAADTIAASTAGTERMRIDSSGNVGIGTSSPSVKLDVIGSIEASAAATQDAIIIAGRAGGTSSYAATLTPTTLTASRTITLPDSTTTMVGTDTTQTLTNKTLTNPTVTNYVESVVAIGTVTTSNTLSLTNGTVQTATLTASTACTFTMPTATAGKSFILLLKQAAATGNGTATFTGVKFNSSGAPTITATAGKMDILSFVSDGTNWYGSYTQGYTP